MSWLQISLPLDRALVEQAAEEFGKLGAAALTMEDAEDVPVLEPAPGETPLWPTVVLTALFDANEDRRLAAIEDTEAWVARQGFQLSLLQDRPWEREWLRDFRPMRFGRRLWVCPGDQQPEEGPGAITVHLDPGLAFGTGTHATTALCLDWLDAHPPTGQRVVDFGCGSGILAIAAAKLGAREVTALDVDPQALTATRENAARNGVAGCLRVLASDEQVPAADLLISNILAGPLVELAPRFARVLSPGTILVMSGILAAQTEAVISAYAACFEFHDRAERDGWVRLAGRRRETD
jgi:ribosomal protein L11 methyltransferase